MPAAMRRINHQAVQRATLLLLALGLLLCAVPTAQAIRCSTRDTGFGSHSSWLSEGTPKQPDPHYEVKTVYHQVRIGLFVGNNPINKKDPLGLAENLAPKSISYAPSGGLGGTHLDVQYPYHNADPTVTGVIGVTVIGLTAAGGGLAIDAYGGSVLGWLGLGGAVAQSPQGQQALREAQRLGPLLQQACVRGKDALNRAIDAGQRLTALINRATAETAFGGNHADAYKLMDQSTRQIDMIHTEFTAGKGWEIYGEVAPEVENALKDHLNKFLP